MKTAKIAVMTGVNTPFEVREYPLTEPAPGMAQLQLVASGVCGTDVHIHRGKIPMPMPAAIGHEFVGQVTALSDKDSVESGIRIGDYAVVDIACPCGHCPLCRSGDDANCLQMATTNSGNPDAPPHFYGGFGEYNYSPVKNLIKIPDGLDPRMVCVYACAGPTALHAFRLAHEADCQVEKAETAVVQGLGPVGSFAVLYLRSLGIPNIIALTGQKQPDRQELALRLGATEVYDLQSDGGKKILQRVKEVSAIGADLVFEASGNPGAIPQGMAMLRNRGTYLVPGQYSNSGTVPIAPQLITFNALRIIGSSQYSVSDVEHYLQFLLVHPEVHEMIGEMAVSYHVEEINQAIEDAAAGRNKKTVIVR